MRGRSRGGGGSGGGGGGKGPNPLTRSYESNGPDVKIRGTAATIADKYVQLSRDALTAGDPVGAENYLQHAEHYYRLLAAAQAQYQPHQTFVRADADDYADLDFDGETEQGEPNGQPYAANGGGQGAPPQNGYQGRNQGGGQQPNGSYGQNPRGGDQNRYDRRDNNYRRDGNRQDARQDGRQDNVRSDGERQDRPERSHEPRERQPRAEEPENVGGLPAFITGGGAAPAPVESVAPAPEPAAAEPAGSAETAAEASAEEGGDPRENFTPSPRGRRRRYGRSRTGSGGEDAGTDAAEPAALPEGASD